MRRRRRRTFLRQKTRAVTLGASAFAMLYRCPSIQRQERSIQRWSPVPEQSPPRPLKPDPLEIERVQDNFATRTARFAAGKVTRVTRLCSSRCRTHSRSADRRTVVALGFASIARDVGAFYHNFSCLIRDEGAPVEGDMAAGVFFAADPVRGHYGNQVRLYMLWCVSCVGVEGGVGGGECKQSQQAHVCIPTSTSAT